MCGFCKWSGEVRGTESGIGNGNERGDERWREGE
jgi:hypothetical protein